MNDDIRNDAVGFDGSTFLQFSEERRKMRYFYIFFILFLYLGILFSLYLSFYIFFIHLNKKALDTRLHTYFRFFGNLIVCACFNIIYGALIPSIRTIT